MDTTNIYDFTVGSELYGRTDCIVDIKELKKGKRVFPCGDGCDFVINEEKKNFILWDIKEMKKRR